MAAPLLSLPVDAHADTIRAAIASHRAAVLVAPPGTGKSTRVPQILWPETGQAIILQPRRIAARNLAARVAFERGEKLGGPVGYQVRFEGASGPDTRVLFETYGVFWQQILRAPTLPGVSLVVLDEFHERTLEADATLAWLKHLAATVRPDLCLVVMSATLEAEAVAEYLGGVPLVEIDARSHPVAIEHVAAGNGEPLAAAVVRGFRHLVATGFKGVDGGSVLVFLPGMGEIRRAAEALHQPAQAFGYAVLELHGTQTPEAQQQALSRPAELPCLVLATNVAETSLTIPGVTAVIDSGQSRQAAYDAERDMNTLKLGWISHANATQRAGRAGRLAPGRCIRLWSSARDANLSTVLPPEIARLDLTRLALDMASLQAKGLPAWQPSGGSWTEETGKSRPPVALEGGVGGLTWLAPPPVDRWQRANDRLVALGALDQTGRPTPLAAKLARFPVSPGLAAVLVAADESGVATLACAMVAIAEGSDADRPKDEADLYLLGLDLIRSLEPNGGGPRPGLQPKGRSNRPGGARFPRETIETYRQLLRLAKPNGADRDRCEAALPAGSAEEQLRRQAATMAWLAAWRHRLAGRQDTAYALADGCKGMLPTKPLGTPHPPLVLALQVHEWTGATGRQVSIPLYLPVEPAWVGEAGRVEVVVAWDAQRQRVVQVCQTLSPDGVVLRKEPVSPQEWDASAAETLLAAKLLSGEAVLEARDEEVEQLILRVQQGAAVWPEQGLPAFDESDWEVLYHELAAGKSSPGAISKAELLATLRDYVGWASLARLEAGAPRRWKLPNGREARITYHADAPPELSARLGDMLGLEGTLAFYEGRVPVLFDILAPNYRTVQKTFDMTGFWTNTYPEVKKELKRRYPKHPWP